MSADTTIGPDFLVAIPEDVEDAIAKVKAEAKERIKALRTPPDVEKDIEKVKAETSEKLKKLRILLRTARKIHGTVKE